MLRSFFWFPNAFVVLTFSQRPKRAEVRWNRTGPRPLTADHHDPLTHAS